MKITVEQLKAVIKDALVEAKKSKKKKGDADLDPTQVVKGYETDDTCDFSKPLGDDNLYKNQGKVNWGPYTEEKAIRMMVRQALSEMAGPVVGHQPPLCQHIFSHKDRNNIWENAMALSEAVCQKCGKSMDEVKLGFKKLKNKLSHEKGVKNPAALAASIGNKKYGKKGMAKKAAAGKK